MALTPQQVGLRRVAFLGAVFIASSAAAVIIVSVFQ